MQTAPNDLHGNAPDTCPVALLIIDIINDLEFPDGPQLLEPALAAAGCIAELKKQAKRLHIPVIYANDNFGHWRSELKALVHHCLQDNVRGKPLVEVLQPDESDYVVLKPKNSAFFATPLHLLLVHLGVTQLILTGISADSCVQFTAQDAYLLEYALLIPSDCVATSANNRTQESLAYMGRVLNADIRPSTDLDLSALLTSP